MLCMTSRKIALIRQKCRVRPQNNAVVFPCEYTGQKNYDSFFFWVDVKQVLDAFIKNQVNSIFISSLSQRATRPLLLKEKHLSLHGMLGTFPLSVGTSTEILSTGSTWRQASIPQLESLHIYLHFFLSYSWQYLIFS